MNLKKMTVLLLALCMILFLLPVNAKAATVAEGVCGEFVTWTLDGNGTLTVSGTGKMYNYGNQNTHFSPYTEAIKKIVIQPGVTSIGARAFCMCYNAETISIPASVTSIGERAFWGCNSLTSVVIPNGVTAIAPGTFNECFKLTSVTIPDSVTSIGESAFCNCTKLQSIKIPSGVTRIEESAFKYCETLTDVKIPEGVTYIGICAFQWCVSMKTVSLPNSLATIDAYAFQSCEALPDVTIPANVTTVGEGAFSFCESLKNVRFKGNAPAFGLYAFRDVTATCYYPANNSTWTSDVMQNYSGTISWATYTPLKITTHPKSVSVAEGETAKVTVKATGDGLSYRWYFKDADDSVYTYTSSFKGNTYSVTMNKARNGRQVLCRVYDKYGNMVQTNTVKLSMAIKTALKITQQPVSVTVAAGEIARVTVKATGDGLTYRWYYKNPGDSGYTYTSSFKGSTYSVTMNEARSGRQVLCRVYDAYGNVVQTNTVKLSMKNMVKIVQQPKSVTVAEGETARVTVNATGDGLTYRWYYKNSGESSYTYTSSFKGNSYYVTMNDARNGRQVLCRIYDKYGNVVQTNTVTLRMS